MYVVLWGATKVIHLAIAYKIVNINDYKFYKTELERILTENNQIREENQKLKKNHKTLRNAKKL